jgi:LmbE family N-acetylglucosaminyl deacetylase
MTEQATPLPSFDETIERVLVVVAHPDDAEYGTSAAVAMWTSAGVDVAYLLLTAGEAGMQRPREEAGPLRAVEQQAACDSVGVKRLTILDFPDGTLEYSLGLREAIAREIRSFRPDVVVSGSGELAAPWGYDHADHRAAGLATIDAVRDADNRWVFPDLLNDGLEHWGARWLLIVGSSHPTHHVAVSDDGRDRAVRSLAAHAAYLADLPWHASAADTVDGILTQGGHAAGVPRAVAFAVHKLRD